MLSAALIRSGERVGVVEGELDEIDAGDRFEKGRVSMIGQNQNAASGVPRQYFPGYVAGTAQVAQAFSLGIHQRSINQ